MLKTLQWFNQACKQHTPEDPAIYVSFVLLYKLQYQYSLTGFIEAMKNADTLITFHNFKIPVYMSGYKQLFTIVQLHWISPNLNYK